VTAEIGSTADRGGVAGGVPAGVTGGTAAGVAGGTTDEPSVGQLVRDASAQLSTLLRDEIELAKAELSATAKRAGVGAGFIAVAAVVVLLSLPFLFVALAEGLVAAGLPRWAAYLIVWGIFIIVAAVAALIGQRIVTRLRGPERTIETVKATASWARHPTGPAEIDRLTNPGLTP
jgi:Putative Actinobacterial Holin-X, holin superfamily III